MKVLVVISAYLAFVLARGSGPYLPRGWKPEGPAFFLPSEISESEASSSDYLREYGPPKVQEVSQDIAQQGLPDVVNEQLFAQKVVQLNGGDKYNVVIEVTEKEAQVKSAIEAEAVTESQKVDKLTSSAVESKSIINIEQDTAEESSDIATVAVAVTESQKVIEIPTSFVESGFVTVTSTEQEIAQENSETTTAANVFESIEPVEDISHVAEPTVRSNTAQEVTNESITQSIIRPTEEKTDLREIIDQQEVPVNSDYQVVESAGDDLTTTQETVYESNANLVTQVATEKDEITQKVVGQEPESNQPDVGKLAKDDATVTETVSEQKSTISGVDFSGFTVSEQAETKFEVTSDAVEKRAQIIGEGVTEVKQVVQNIPDVIVSLENEVKSQKAQIIQNAPEVFQGALGSLEEGFLEYGPPGFTEYGPPKEELKENTTEAAKVVETGISRENTQAADQTNQTRKRRFSPKLRLSLN